MEPLDFQHIFEQYYRPMVRWATSYLHDQQEAEDIVLDAMMYYWERRDTLPADTNVPAYILTTVKHKCLNHLQHQAMVADTHESMREVMEEELIYRSHQLEACDPQDLYSSEIRQIVRDTFLHLSDKTAEVFRLSREKNLPYKQIADQLHISTKAVEYHISRALDALRKNLKEYLPLLLGCLPLSLLLL